MFGSSARAAAIYTIDFEVEDDFATPLVHGQSVYSTARPNNVNPAVPFSTDSKLEYGRLIGISSTNLGSDGHLGPAIFDSDTPGGEADLLVGLGNILMLQRDENPGTTLHATQGLVFNNPNDEATPDDTGSIVIDFLVSPVHPISIDLIDVDVGVNMVVRLTDRLGLTRTYDVPTNWTTDVTDAPNGYQTLSLETLMNQMAEPNATGSDATAMQDPGFNDRDVARLEVRILGALPSGAIDNLVFSVPEPGSLLLGALGALALCSGRRVRTIAFPPKRGVRSAF
jgi:hypothetical protein